MPRGGKRPGAGAPKGNLNALKSGRYSQRLNHLFFALAQVPELRYFLHEVRRRQLRQERQAARLARKAILDLLHASPGRNNPLIAYLLATNQLQENGQNGNINQS